MVIWAIADLHLGQPGPPDAHVARWRNHVSKLDSGWRSCVGPRDLVLIPGDISFARNHRDVQPDLAWLASLPGTKMLTPGNHDTWWNRQSSVSRILRRNMIGLDGQAVSHGGAIFAGARSAPVPSDDEADSGVRARFALALSGLENALASAARLRDRDQPLFVLWHDPPHGRHGASSPVTEQLDHAGATACVFGHVHAESQWATRAPSGSVRYLCVAADALGFHPIRLFG